MSWGLVMDLAVNREAMNPMFGKRMGSEVCMSRILSIGWKGLQATPRETLGRAAQPKHSRFSVQLAHQQHPTKLPNKMHRNRLDFPVIRRGRESISFFWFLLPGRSHCR